MSQAYPSSDLRSDQLAPHSIEAEEAVLGSILINPEALPACIPIVNPDNMFIVRHSWILEAMIELYNRHDPVDYLTVVSEIEQRGRLAEIGGAAYVLSLINKTPSALNVEGYAMIVHRMAIRRMVIEHAQTSARLAHSDETDIDVILHGVNQSLGLVNKAHVDVIGDSTSIDDVMAEVAMEAVKFRDHPSLVHGWPTGIRKFDIATMGLETDDYVIIAARPGMGKSSLLMQIMLGLVLAGARCLLFSFEMGRRKVGTRMACQRAHISGMKLLRGELSPDEFARYMAATDEIAKLKDRLIIDTRRGIDVNTMRSIADSHRHSGGLDFIFVDTVNRVVGQGSSRYERMTDVSQSLADMSDDNVGVVAAAQLRRSDVIEVPQMDDIKESGSFEQDADHIFAIHRLFYYTRLAIDKHHAEIYHLKDRNGEGGDMMNMYWSDSPSFEPLETRNVDLDSGTVSEPLYNGNDDDDLI